MSVKLEAFNWDSIPITAVQSANPAAGADPVGLTVAAGKRVLLIGAAFTLVTDANAANRLLTMTIRPDGTNELILVSSTTAHTASLTRYYRWQVAKTYGETLVGSIYIMGLGIASGSIEIPAGGTVSFAITNKQVGDDASATTLYYKEAPA